MISHLTYCRNKCIHLEIFAVMYISGSVYRHIFPSFVNWEGLEATAYQEQPVHFVTRSWFLPGIFGEIPDSEVGAVILGHLEVAESKKVKQTNKKKWEYAKCIHESIGKACSGQSRKSLSKNINKVTLDFNSKYKTKIQESMQI